MRAQSSRSPPYCALRGHPDGMMTSEPDSFWRTHALLPLIAFATVFFVLEVFALDPVIARAWFFDVHTMHWLGTGPGDWWARGLLHSGGRWFVRAVAALAIV